VHAAGVLVPIAYLLIGAALYASTLDIFFMSDDFEFLTIVASAQSVSVIFEPLVGRYVRPLVVLMYYVSYHTIGLAPWGYHVSTLLPHFIAAWLVYLVARRLGGDDDHLWAFLSGLLFLVFSGHSEAVTWPAGIADPILTVFLLTAFLCYLRALQPGASARWLAGMFAAVLVGTQAKEMWVVFPGLLVVHALAFGVVGDPPARRRAFIAVAGTSAMVAAYLAMRHLVFGSVAGGYAGLGSSLEAGVFDEQARAFLLRSFAPATPRIVHGMVRGLDLILAPLGLLLLAWSARGRTARVLIFSGLALVVALAPVLPLTISISTTESERFVYLPSAFSCIFLVWAIRAVLSRRALAVAACTLVIVVHAAALARANTRWEASGALTRSIVDSYAEAVLEHDPDGAAAIFILNLPDNVGGAYVFRNGFYPAVQLVRPDVGPRTGRTFPLATQSVGSFGDEVRVTKTGDRRFTIDLGSNLLSQPQLLSSFYYRILSQTPGSYEVEFGESIASALVLYLTRGRLELAGTITGPGLPFGTVDIPADGASCEGDSIRFAGWALDNEGVARVTLSAIEPDASAARGTSALLADAVWVPGERPDVARIFAGYPNADRASWEFQVPCARAARNPAGTMRVRVVAQDVGGRETLIGERTVRALK